MRVIAVLMSLCFILQFSRCTTCSTKKVSCAAFVDPAFDKWFPYNDSSRMLFKNTTNNDTFSYMISSRQISAAYETSRGGFENANHPCVSSAYFASSNYNNSPFGTLVISYTVNNDQLTKSLVIHFNNADWKTGAVTENSFALSVEGGADSQAKIDSAQNYLFENNRVYNTVAILTTDTGFNKTDRAYKIFIAKNIGIIGCEMYPSKQKWVIQ